MRAASLSRPLHVSHKNPAAGGMKAFHSPLAPVGLTKFIFPHMILLQCLSTSALSFGVYLVVILHDIVHPTLCWKKKKKSRSISATTAVQPWESNKYLCLSTKYEVRQDTLKGNSHYLPFQSVLMRIKHIKDVFKFSFRAGQITLTWISLPSGFVFALQVG